MSELNIYCTYYTEQKKKKCSQQYDDSNSRRNFAADYESGFRFVKLTLVLEIITDYQSSFKYII